VTVSKKRPVNLDLTTIELPLPGLTSILHRVTGVILFLGLIFFFYAFDLSLADESGFNTVKSALEEHLLVKFIAWGLLTALGFHLLAGVKHLIMDFGYAEELESANLAARLVLAGSAILAFLAGVWVW
jgi:succinate dehydrogenase / fumarate reductase cytochrome b subunit